MPRCSTWRGRCSEPTVGHVLHARVRTGSMRVMATFLLTAIVAFLAFSWVRKTQRARQRWLTRVSLVGQWTTEVEHGASVIEFSGGPAEGVYRERGPGREEQGRWTLHGAHLTLAADGGRSVDYDFRLFEDGSIGIDGPGRERRLYARRVSNVVPLRGRR